MFDQADLSVVEYMTVSGKWKENKVRMLWAELEVPEMEVG